jgi:hypothetical protein
MHDRYKEEVNRSFSTVCGKGPLFEREVKGLPMIKRAMEALFGSSSP